jgi:hypothetical protein
MWESQPLATLRASTACTGITLPYIKEKSGSPLQDRMVNEVCGISLYSDNHMKPINTLRGQNEMLFNAKSGGTYR